MSPYLRELRNLTMAGMVFPDLRFFTPLESFYTALEPYKEKRFVDAGTGSGKLPEEAMARDFTMLGIDIARRDGQSCTVYITDAETFPYNESTWLLMCRPDHSGWCLPTMKAALRAGANVFYVGLARNFTHDLDCYVNFAEEVWQDVGKDGEAMFMFTPEALKKEEVLYGNCEELQEAY